MKRLLGISALVACAACGYDWTVGPAPPSEGGGDGSVTEAGIDDAGGTEASSSGEGGPTCDGLSVQLEVARSQILACTGTCGQQVLNECLCPVAVVDASSQAAKAYAAAAAQYRQHGCATSCPPQCDTVYNLCISQSGGNGVCA